MAILFDRVPAAEIGTRYTHFGRFYGIVPVYLGDPFGPCPDVAVRNGWPDWLLDVADLLWSAAAWVHGLIDPDFDHPGFMFTVTGRIPPPGGRQ
jgi:hypothetical protein